MRAQKITKKIEKGGRSAKEYLVALCNVEKKKEGEKSGRGRFEKLLCIPKQDADPKKGTTSSKKTVAKDGME